MQKGFISTVGEHYPMRLNEAEVAYCVDVYNERQKAKIGHRGVPLLDKNGLPYKLKLPNLAVYSRERNHKRLLPLFLFIIFFTKSVTTPDSS